MDTFFLVCAALGGAVLLLQLALGLFGLSHDADFHADAGAGETLNLLSARSVAAGLAFFGIAGLAILALGVWVWVALPVAIGVGISAAAVMALLMRMLGRFESDGTARIETSIGHAATVYLTIPGQKTGAGKVLLSLQNRTVECQAVTSLDELPTGTSVVVVDVIGPDTVEVAPAPELGGPLNVSS